MWVPNMSVRFLVPNISSEAVPRVYLVVVAATAMWEIRANSVGNGRQAATKSPSRQGYVARSSRGIDRTQGFASTKTRRKTVSRQEMLGAKGPDGWIGSAEYRRGLGTDFVVPTIHTPSATKPIGATLFQFRVPVGAENVIWIP